MKPLLPAIALLFSTSLNATGGDRAPDPFPEVETISLSSEVLGEDRYVYLSYPEGYDYDGSLPLVVVTDAKSQFPLVSAYIQNQSRDWGRLPPMVVAGIVNTNRNRDFLPREDANFRGAGGGDAFANFLRMELLPRIEAEIGGASARILVGHSFGGVNALNILLTDDELFDSYIAIGTSTWVADRVLFERARQRFSEDRPLDSWLYMAVAERDGGATVPDGKLFADLFEQEAPEGLDWKFEVVPQTDHFSAVPVALTRAFNSLYPVWDQQAEVISAAQAGPEAISAWFAAKESQLGWRFWPHAWDMMIAAYTLGGQGRSEEALTLLEETAKFHPRQAELLVAAGDLLIATGRREDAIKQWRAALAILDEDGAPEPRMAPVWSRLERAD